MSAAITRRPLSVTQVARQLGDPASGGAVLFVGRVRPDVRRGRRILALDYEADSAMALAALRRLEAEARRRFGVRRVRVVHRIGRLRVGTASVIVGVAAPHRTAAFEAARFLIERLKREAPIWKSDRWAPARAGRRRRTRPRPTAARSPG
jgi:molybdopterin synthase catalytic subunit